MVLRRIMAQQKTDLQIAVDAIDGKAQYYETLYSYLDGAPELKYSTARLSRAFAKSFVYFAQNWAGVIINAVLDRLVLKGFDIGDNALNTKMDEVFTKLNLNLEAQDVHEACQVTGEGFLIVDKLDTGVDVYFNDPRMCEVFYDADRPKIKAFAAKKWLGSDGVIRVNLYYPDRTEKYAGEKTKNMSLLEKVTNDTGVIPVFHFRNSRRVMKGELDPSTLSELDAINKLFSDLMVAAEFEAFKTKVIISQVDPGDLQLGADMKIHIPARETSDGEDTKILEIGGGDLERFIKPINEIANALSAQTRTPKHFFVSQSDAGLSGEALLTMEAPLVKKVQKKQEAYAPEWQAAMAYILKLMGTEVNASELSPVWQPVQSELPLTSAQIFKTEKEAGIPTINSARRMGFDETAIAQLEDDMNTNNNNSGQVVPTA